jgi:hypothetical protein
VYRFDPFFFTKENSMTSLFVNSCRRFLPLLCAAALFSAGCSEQPAKKVGDAAKDAAGKAGEMAKDAAQAAGDTAKDAAKAVTDALGEGYSSAIEKAASALKGVEGGGEALAKIKDLFGSATESLKGVTDKVSAEAAVSKLTDLSGSVDGLKGMLDKLPAAAKTTVQGVIGQGVDGLKALVEKVMALPGVQDVLKPTVDQLMSKLEGFVGKPA